jgi:hypothetical protein
MKKLCLLLPILVFAAGCGNAEPTADQQAAAEQENIRIQERTLTDPASGAANPEAGNSEGY